MFEGSFNLILILGICLATGIVLGSFCRAIKLPQVIGHILAGVMLGLSGIHLLSLENIDSLKYIIDFALGMLGFMIGGELRWARIKRYSSSILIITLFETFGAFILVSLCVFLISRNLEISLILGSLASATAPGGTSNVLQECRARGPLTTTIFGVIALDDVFSILMFTGVMSYIKLLHQSNENLKILDFILPTCLELGGAIVIGIVIAILLQYILKLIKHQDLAQLVILASLMIIGGLAVELHLSIVLCNLIFGLVLSNINPFQSRKYFQQIQPYFPPLFIFFFILVGANLNVSLLGKLGSIGVAYIIFRMLGKYIGAFTGSIISKAKKNVKHYLGLCLMSQAGVAIGLALSAKVQLSTISLYHRQLGIEIVTIITGATLFFQIIGPILTKFSLIKSEESRL